jgi:riboflavin kinase/FMN adenylyltransferase
VGRNIDFLKRTVVCLGNFDGCHRGHQAILSNCLREARSRGVASVAFTFWPHPRRFFKPASNEPRLLLGREERIELLKRTGIDAIIMQDFDEDFSRIEARDFMKQILCDRLGAELVIVGRDFHFGHRALGNPDLLRSSGYFSVLECRDERVLIEGRELSIGSSLVRDFVAKGDLEAAELCLGYPFFISGQVVKGHSRGEETNARTANIEADRECVVPAGVYASMLEDLETGHRFAAVSNLGFAPTYARERFCIESHLLGFTGDLYGRNVRLFLLKSLRAEIKFSNLADLRAQIEKDVAESLEFFSEQKLFHSQSFKKGVDLMSPAKESQSFRPLDFLENLESSSN